MQLCELCSDIEYSVIQGSLEIDVTDIVYDSRNSREGVLFVCMVGSVTDGHLYIKDAVEKGAAAIMLEREVEDVRIPKTVTVIKVESARNALALASAAFFGHPAEKLVTVGVTGTKGKTTVTCMIREIISRAGEKAGLIGTISVIAGDKVIPSKNTTPESYDIHKYMAEMVKAGCRYVVMEVSSQGIMLDRTAGITFDCGVFTNLSPDHIGPGEHSSFEEYLRYKSMLFRQCIKGVANADDSYTDRILEGHTCSVTTFAAENEADLTASSISFFREKGKLGMRFETHGIMECSVMTCIPGRFSVYNALAAMTACKVLGIPENAILEGIKYAYVKGRVEPVPISEDFGVIIDYAHNEVSTVNVLETLRQYRPSRLTVIFGCGGNRARSRRFDMGRAAGRLADMCIVTSDNPRFEKPADINRDIKVGLDESHGKYIEIDDRKEAIAYAVTHAVKGELIALLGKGHEDYIEQEGVRRHFSEHEAIYEIADEIKQGKREMSTEAELI